MKATTTDNKYLKALEYLYDNSPEGVSFKEWLKVYRINNGICKILKENNLVQETNRRGVYAWVALKPTLKTAQYLRHTYNENVNTKRVKNEKQTAINFTKKPANNKVKVSSSRPTKEFSLLWGALTIKF